MIESGLEIMPGTPGLYLARVGHILVPGRGRDSTGVHLSQGAIDRVKMVERLYETGFPGADRSIICSGYKSPSDKAGVAWTPDSSSTATYCGVPEADLMKAALIAAGVPDRIIQVERESIDTATNLLRVEREGYFDDDMPVAIVAQRAHLARILTYIAPKVLSREFVGIVVPEIRGLATESPFARMCSMLILRNLPSDSSLAISIATHRAEVLWRLASAFGAARRYHLD